MLHSVVVNNTNVLV